VTTLDDRLDRLEAKIDAIVGALGQPVAVDQPELLTPVAAAKALSICTKTLREHIKRGLIRTVAVGKRYRIPRSEVQRFAAPKTAAPRGKRRAAETYDARAEYEKTMKRLGGRR
jgi:excisionase family DNA binding protein